MRSNRKIQSSEKGFALATALMACAILFALAMLIIQLSTSDLKVSVRNVGDKKASIAAETGIQQVLTGGDPKNLPPVTDLAVDADNAPGSVYSFTAPAPPPKDSGRPASALMPGYSSPMGQARYETRITGRNTRYDTSVQVDLGVGYIDIITTDYR
ncbi:MAG: hypothetical protein WCK00_03040 [Deltaproteobacteria bacterium]